VSNDLSSVREGRHVLVRPIVPGDYEALHQMAVMTPAGAKWRLFGEVPLYEEFLRILFMDAKVTSIVQNLETRQAIGMVQLWSHDPLSRTAHITAFLDPAFHELGWPLEGIGLFVDYAFTAFDLRKIYVEVLETSLDQYRGLVGRVLVEEGRLKAHRYVMGELVDCYIFALYRDVFEETLRPLLATGASADA
jgi:RimJ/RimL family protein N-acetyltransferase